ncbi:phosphatidylinositol 3-kinase [Mytilus galloprovincialis]|uniref:Phosphatidylinositol 3-kinase n=2 Tax=Mytilus TaxID=6548 RepID=A0A8B6F581_MYTGA|nr:phosphatidylinositol 3-kinase [Mytilus galloprovincialis]
MDSKKKPFWLEWTNDDEKGQNIQLIYKCGDDLRQDMLTLQILEVMDTIWQSEGYDLRLNPYGCVATGCEEGMIEVVQKSLTLAGIQKWRKLGLDKRSLYDWLKHKNPTEHSLQRAVEEFKLSCAGYAVATYILGVGDRHNDNIMMKETGQLFHIDFGHFLGNKKTKFNINRERVPFILTSHFEYIIKDGEKKPQNFTHFKEICERAYLIIRSRAHLLIQLFMMMLSSGIPQLNNVSDIDYIKEVLALNSTQEEALEKFRKKFKEAQESSWSTTVNWWFHMRVH